ncbi:M48 family metallopeptidase [Mitsuaria sp. WAJ17]|uniref:M48 family metallopeptidase n=1 Tax=Mitsuaria sp. WAJ17 TaxID=2761452 RepID=UPI0016023B4E|nr:SprT family zinc-dependent metalloprotease [Mitsuaria sp. WAJ17]MBB2487267.1 M48 family metallopeptidase [Mitsuaria sp. WAJ17]
MLHRLAGLFQYVQLSLFEREPEPPSASAPQEPAPPVRRPPRRSSMPPSPLQSPPPAPAIPTAPARSVQLGTAQVDYELRRARRRSIGFTISEAGLRVSAPKWVPVGEIERALQHKAAWILRKLQEQRDRTERLAAAQIRWADGCVVPYLGQDLIIVLDPSAERLPLKARLDSGLTDPQPSLASVPRQTLYLGLPQEAAPQQIRDAVLSWLQAQARSLFTQRCAHFATQMGVRISRLRLSSAQTRWGSASIDGSVRLNWRLIHFEPATIDYVVVHELAHLHEMNHSPRFWAVVGAVLPDYEQARHQLRRAALPDFSE